jgi:hypothetical protein
LLKRTFKLLSSIKLAIVILFILSIGLTIATVLESRFDAQVAAYFVYSAFWFYWVIYIFALNIIAVVVDRYPWKKKHIPFLLAHLGILIVLIGSWGTQKFGIDATMRLTENEHSNVLTTPQNVLWLQRQQKLWLVSIPYLPPFVTFKPRFFKGPNLWVIRYITHAEPRIQFAPKKEGFAAVHLKIVGGPMKLNQDLWLWQGQKDWQSLDLGPAKLEIGQLSPLDKAQVGLSVSLKQGTYLEVISRNSDGKTLKSVLPLTETIGTWLPVNWKASVRVMLLNAYTNASANFDFVPAQEQYGSAAPPPAIEVVLDQDLDSTNRYWLSLGSRFQVEHAHEGALEVGYVAREIHLPFELKLLQFMMQFDPGTHNPASYQSHVEWRSGEKVDQVMVQMNEPLKKMGYTIYQASYEPKEPRPITSIFTVNQDPGRDFKYWGSFLIVLGSFLLFLQKYLKFKRSLPV